MMIELHACRAVNEAFVILSAFFERERREEDKTCIKRETVLKTILLDHLRHTIPSTTSALTNGETALLHNLLWIGQLNGHFPDTDCTQIWKAAMRWPHAVEKAEPFLTQHTFALFNKGKRGALTALISMTKVLPELILSTRESLTRQSLSSSSSSGQSKHKLKIANTENETADWFHGAIEDDPKWPTNKKFQNLLHLRAFVLKEALEDEDPVVSFVLMLFEDESDLFTSSDLMIKTCMEWTLYPHHSRQLILKCWQLMHNLLIRYPIGYYSCDHLIGVISRQIDRLLRRSSVSNDCLYFMMKSILLMSCEDDNTSLYEECLCKLSGHCEDERILACLMEYVRENVNILDEAMTKTLAGGLLYCSCEDLKREIEVFVTTKSLISDHVPLPLNDEGRVAAAVKEDPYWTCFLSNALPVYPKHRKAILNVIGRVETEDLSILKSIIMHSVDAIVNCDADCSLLDTILRV